MLGVVASLIGRNWFLSKPVETGLLNVDDERLLVVKWLNQKNPFRLLLRG
jgi:hypothetical protein